VSAADLHADDIPWADDVATDRPTCGRDSCEGHPRTGAALPRQRLAVRARDLMAQPAPVEIVEGIAWAGCVTVMAAESGGGKTFISTSLAGAVSDGVPWCGRAVVRGSVVYLGFESDALGVRFQALHEVEGRTLDHVYVIRTTDPISPGLTREGEECSIGEYTIATELAAIARDVAAAGAPPIRLTVIDTVRQSMSGSEDSSEHVSAYLRAVRRLMAGAPEAAWILNHHTGWQDGDSPRRRERGSSAWRGNCDATLYLEAGEYDPVRAETRLTLHTRKVRDGERPPPLHLVRRRVGLSARDARGRPVTSCVIDGDDRTAADVEAERTEAGRRLEAQCDRAVLRAIRDRAVTSQAELRDYAGLGAGVVAEALGRVLRAGWARRPERQRQPYTLTAAGVQALTEAP
jgi:AAA domain